MKITAGLVNGFGRVKSKDRDEYFKLYADAGWQYVTSTIGWHYFRSGVTTNCIDII